MVVRYSHSESRGTELKQEMRERIASPPDLRQGEVDINIIISSIRVMSKYFESDTVEILTLF